MNYIQLMQIAYYDIMSVCEDGECSDFHFMLCLLTRHCFYDDMLQASYCALEMGWA